MKLPTSLHPGDIKSKSLCSPSVLTCCRARPVSSFNFLAIEFLPQRSSQRIYPLISNFPTDTVINGHLQRQDFGPLISGSIRGVEVRT